MNSIKRVAFSAFALIISTMAHAAAPNWTVNPAAFQYSMNVTAAINIGCVESTDPSDQIAAFVGGQCRGVANINNFINGRYIGYMIVYSNLAAGETVTFKMYDASADLEIDATNSVAFQENSSYGFSGNPYVLFNNNAPTDIALSNNSVPENIAIGGTIGTLSTSDINNSDTHTYSLVGGTGSTDNAKFSITGSTLKTAAALSYATQTTYSVRIKTDDGKGCSYEEVFQVSITNVNDAPSLLLINDSTVMENSISLTVVGTFDAVDPDGSTSFSYGLVAGAGDTSNALFNISGSNLRTLASFNYENKSYYWIRVRVTDPQGAYYERAIKILVEDANDAPTNIQLSASAFAENQAIGTTIGTLSTTDEDVNNSFTYSFANNAGNNNSNFSIVGNQLRTASNFDFETLSNYIVYIQTNDGNGGTFTKQFVLTVTDANDAPTAIAITYDKIAENQSSLTYIGTFSSTDPDGSSGGFTYSLVAGAGSTGNGSFLIRNDSLFSNAQFNYETLSSYSIRVKTTDGSGASYQQTLSISVTDANDAPTAIDLNNMSVNENQVYGTVVGTFSTTDPDANNIFTYSLVAGAGSTDNASFYINGNVLKITTPFDYETKKLYSVRVRTSDGQGGSFETTFEISILDINDAPTQITLSNNSVAENKPLNTLIGTFSSTDQDAANSHTYSFANVSGNSNSSFIIMGNQLLTAASFDFETLTTYYIYVTTNDGNGGTDTKQFSINITDANDAPTAIYMSSSTISENQWPNSLVGRFSSSDADQSNTFTYNLVAGGGSANNSSFIIRNDSLLTVDTLSFANKPSYSIRVRSTDNAGGQTEAIFVINILDTNNPPHGLNIDISSIAENQSIGTKVGKFSTLDVDLGQAYTYSLVAGTGSTNNNKFTILGDELKTNAVFNFENQNSYAIRVQTTDGNGGSFTQVFTINVTDLNDAPDTIKLSNNSVNENLPVGSNIGVLSTIDQDAGDVFNYSLTSGSGNDNDKFIISGNQLKTAATLDYETKNIYIIYVQSTDAGGKSLVKQFAINVNDTPDAPVDMALTNNTVLENKPAGTYVGLLSSVDIDSGSQFTYTLVNGIGATGNSAFKISGDSILTNSVLDFEKQKSYSIRIRTTDNGSAHYEESFTITIVDDNDAPTGLAISNSTVTENLPVATKVGTFSTTDEDANSSFSYALVAGSGDTDNSKFQVVGNELRTAKVFNYEQANTFSVRVQTNDSKGGTYEKEFTITIEDGNDAPTAISLSNLSFAENRSIGAFVSTLSTTDQDPADTFTYSFVNTTGNDNSSFLIVGNQLRMGAPVDFETKNFYIVFLQTQDNNGKTFTSQFVLSVVDSSDAPTNINLSNNFITENLSSGTYIGKFSTTDIDAGASASYSLIGGLGATDNGSFKIVNDSLISNISFNYELKNIYSVRVRTTDNNGLFYEKSFTINIADDNDEPTGLSISNTTVNENTPVSTQVGIFTTADVDANSSFSYTFVSGTGDTDNSKFQIFGNELRTGKVFNFEQANSFSVRVQANDGHGGTFQNQFTITINNVNDGPTAISLSTLSFAENRAIGAFVATLSTTDEDTADNFTYSFINTAGNDNSAFLIVGNQLRMGAPVDFETKNFYIVYLQTDDNNGKTFTSQFVLSVVDSSDAPTNINLSNNFINENLPSGTSIGKFSTTDIDAGATATYTLVGGGGATDNGSFRIVNDSLVSNIMFNYESKNSYSVRVRTTDNNGLTFEKIFTITIGNTNDGPYALTLSNKTFNENISYGVAIGTFSTSDYDASDIFTYTLSSGSGDTDNASFVISGNELKPTFSANFEEKSVYSIRVKVTDSGKDTLVKQFTINVSDVNEKPVAIADTFHVSESAAKFTVIGQARFTDVDLTQSHSFSIVESEVPFDISSSGNITLKNKVNYEDVKMFDIHVAVADNGFPAMSDTATIRIIIDDAVEDFFPLSNFMSPNGDGKNDFFEIQNPELYKDYSITFYSGDGEKVYFSASNYNNDWDGTFKGAELPTGVYFYYITNTSTGREYKGSINIVR